jgi:ATP-binding cassette, subfamily G (WHITE), member 2, SNQ2
MEGTTAGSLDDKWYSHYPQNFGILVAFIIGFVGASLIFTEINARTPANSGATLYKRNAKNKLPRNGKARDEEEKLGETVTVVDSGELNEKDCNMHVQIEEKVATPGSVSTIAPPVAKDIFSWQNVNYTVQIKDGSSRRLLNNVTGFVAPGKLTALMGESGAGKVNIFSPLYFNLLTYGHFLDHTP